MKTHARLLFVSLLLVSGFAATGRAEIKEVRMKIGGYLCGM